MQNHDSLANVHRPAFHFMPLSGEPRRRSANFAVHVEFCDGRSLLIGEAITLESAQALARMVKADPTAGIASVRITRRTKGRVRKSTSKRVTRHRQSSARRRTFFRQSKEMIDFASLGAEENV